MMRNHVFTKTLPVRLTEADTLRIAKELARSQQELDRAKQHKKEVAAAAEARVKLYEAQVSKAATTLNQGWEDRDVACETWPDWDRLAMVTQRLDTFEEVDARPMTADERQRPLPIDTVPVADSEAQSHEQLPPAPENGPDEVDADDDEGVFPPGTEPEEE